MNIQSKSPVRLRTNLADYPGTKVLKSGAITSPIVELEFAGPKVAHDGFKPMLRENAFDAGELAIVTFLQAKIYNKPYVLLPVPILARQQHHCVGYNSQFGDISPKDIEGKKVGVRSYTQTTGLWVRGILQDEYGVDLNKVTWMTLDDGHLAEYSDPANCERLPKGTKLPDLLFSGEIAAAILGNDMPDDPRIKTLIPDAKKAGDAWGEREHVLPINHLFVVRSELSKERPDVVREIFRMLVESRKQAQTSVLHAPFGLEANRKGLQLAIDWAYDQKIIPRKLTVDELFDETTAALTP